MKKIGFLFGAIFLLSCRVWAATYDPKLVWRTTTTEHFNIHYYEGEEAVVAKLVPMVEEVYQDLTQRWDCRPWGRTEVVVTDRYDQANGFTEIIPYNLIELRVVPPAADSSLADMDDWMRGLFTHEFTHVLHLTDTRYPARLAKFLFGSIVAPNGLTPGWVIEGLPTYFETRDGHGGRGQSAYADMLLRTDVLTGRFLKIDEMAGSQYHWPAWQAQYLYGVGFWNYLAQTYGEKAVLKFSHKYGASLWFFSLNNKAKRSFKKDGRGKSFYSLWRDWKGDLDRRYGALREELEAEGLEEGEPYLTPREGESFSQPVFSADRRLLAYVAHSVDHAAELRLRDTETGKEKILVRKKDIQQTSFSPDGKTLVYSAYGVFQRYANVADLYEVNLETLKSKPLTEGKRARDPDVSPDGKTVISVIQKTGEATLALYRRETKEWKDVLTAPQMSFPRWVDDREVVFMIHKPSKLHARRTWQLVSVDTETGAIKVLRDEGIVQSRPVVDRQRGVVYFSSDGQEGRGPGIFNIHAYDLKTERAWKVSNVTSGAFAPAVAGDGKVVFQYYGGRGYELRMLSILGNHGEESSPGSSATRVAGVTPPARLNSPTGLRNLDRSAAYSRLEEPGELSSPGSFVSKKYSPWKKLFLPRAVFPNLAFIDGSFFLSGTIINHDPLSRHLWYADVNYRSDNRFLGYGAGYTYNRFRLPVSAAFADYSVNYGDIYRVGSDYFEERRRASIGVSYPWKSSRLSVHYFFENRTTQSGLPAGAAAPTLGRYAGFLAQYGYRNTSSTLAAISQEKGGRFSLNFEGADHHFGSSRDLEQYVAWGDARAYLKLPYSKHHVLALRAAGGAAFGDQLLQGNFGLGGSLGESLFTGTTTHLFTLRGLPLSTFSRDRVWVSSVEYRFPLVSIERGLGTLPLAINQAHLAFFADLGDAMRRDATRFRPLLGVGAELRADFILSWHLPVTGRLGYGVIVTNRDRIVGLKDDLTGADARNGVVVLELGTSF